MEESGPGIPAKEPPWTMPRWVYPRRSDAVAVSELDDELVLYDSATQQVHVLNHSAAAIWRLCDGTRTPAAIARDVARYYGVSVRLVQ